MNYIRYNFFLRITYQLPLLFCFILFCFVYFYIYHDIYIISHDESWEGIGKFVNLHDHYIYQEKLLELVSNSDVYYEFNNNFGISLIYKILYVDTGIDNLIDIYWFALIFNSIFLVLSFLFYNKICSIHKLSSFACCAFFLNFSFIYFCQLINKDMLTIFFLLATLYYGIRHQYLLILLMLPFAFLIRQQLGLCLVTFLFLMKCNNTRFWIFFSYVVSSIAAGYLAAHADLIAQETLGNGLSSFLMKFNKEFYIGYLIFNPIRFLLYFYSIPQSFFSIYDGHYIDFAAFFRFLIFPLCFLAFIFVFNVFKTMKRALLSEIKPYFILTYSFFICWLMNPTINSRYFMLIFPVMLLGYFFQKKNLIK